MSWVLVILAVLFYLSLALFILACLLILCSIIRDIFGIELNTDWVDKHIGRIQKRIDGLNEKQTKSK